MNKVLQSGKYFFALAMAGFAIIQFVTLSLPSEFMPLLANMPVKAALAIVTGLLLLASSVSIITNKMAKKGALLIGILFFIFLLYPHLPKLLSNVYNPSEWVSFLETLCFSCGGFILASQLPADSSITLKWENIISKVSIAGRYMFAAAILIFGIQHIMYEKFIVTLIPSWIPAKMFWSYIVKAAFILTAVSVAIRIQSRLALTLLGVMFLLWVLILHGPRVIANPKIEPEWTSFFVAMAMSGICFLLASTYQKDIDLIEKKIPMKVI